MAISPFTQAVQARKFPVNYNLLAGLQAQELDLYSRAKQKTYQDHLQGEALIDNADMLLASPKAYGTQDNQRLNQKRDQYSNAISEKVAAAKGNYSSLLPFAKEMRRQISKDVQFGELAEINTRYQRSQANLENINERIAKGTLRGYMVPFAKQNLLNPVPDNINLGDEAAKVINSKATENKTRDQVIEYTMDYMMQNPTFAQQLAYAKAAGDEYYNAELKSIIDAVDMKYRISDSENAGNFLSGVFGGSGSDYTTSSQGVDFGDTQSNRFLGLWGTKDEVIKAFMPRIRMDGITTTDQGRDIIDAADKKAKDMLFNYVDIPSAKDMREITSLVKEKLDDVAVYELGGDNKTGQLSDILNSFNDDEQKEFWNSFTVVGMYKNNPYIDGALVGKAKVGGQMHTFVVGNPDLKNTAQAFSNSLYMDIWNSDSRLTGNTPLRQLGNTTRYVQSVPVIDHQGVWGYEVKEYDTGIKGVNNKPKLMGTYSPREFDQRLRQ